MGATRVTLEDVRTWPAVVPVPDAARVLNISRSYGFELVRQGRFPCKVITVGTRHRVVTASLLALLDAANREAG